MKAATLLVLILCTSAMAEDMNAIVQTSHNLAVPSATTQTAQTTQPSQQQLCISCHAPHIDSRPAPLWDPDIAPSHRPIFSAKSSDALPGQPTGDSKMCLSCHDGTIAPGNIVAKDQSIATAQPMSTAPRGKMRAGSDLCDDHPISFRFDSTLASQNTWLKNPTSIGPATKLDANGEVQCSSCHTVHDDTNGNFLATSNSNGFELCRSCHQLGPTSVEHHQSCLACHQPHTAPSGDRLLRSVSISTTCISCHGGNMSQQPQGPNIAEQLRKLDIHDTDPSIEMTKHPPTESACTDCHEPHTIKTGLVTAAPSIRGKFGDIDGVTAIGTHVPRARFEYEVCFKCHGDKHDVEPMVTRQIQQNNRRLEFSTSAVSFHPVEGRGTNPYVPSLLPPMTTASIIYCTDCHNSDSGKKAGGRGASGPHGSENPGLLIARYDLTDYTAESSQAYALCYKCHSRSSILSDQSFAFHRDHVVNQKTPCSACHDPHGISSAQGTPQHNAKLINFDVRIVHPSNSVREFTSTGPRHGNCTLTCHGVDHQAFPY